MNCLFVGYYSPRLASGSESASALGQRSIVHGQFLVISFSVIVVVMDCQTANEENIILTTIEGHDVILTCPVLEDLQSSDFHKHIGKLEWFRNNALIATFSQARESAEWWVSDARYSLDRIHFSLTISPSLLVDKGFYTCIPDLDAFFEDRLLKNLDTVKCIFVFHYFSRYLPDELKVENFEEESASPGNRTKLCIENLTPFTQYAFYVIAENFAGRSRPSKQSDALRTAGEDEMNIIFVSNARIHTKHPKTSSLFSPKTGSLFSSLKVHKVCCDDTNTLSEENSFAFGLNTTPSLPPTIVNLINSTNGSVLITFKPTQDLSTVNGPILGYKIGLEEPGRLNFTKVYINNGHATTYRFLNLKPNTVYKVILQLDNGFGLSPPIVASFSTSEKAPSDAPEFINLKITSGREVDISWNSPRVPNGILISYTIYASSDSKDKHNKQFVRNINPHAISTVLKNLEPYCHYQLKISASTSMGEGPRSEPIFFVTDTAGKLHSNDIRNYSPSTYTYADCSLLITALFYFKFVIYVNGVDLSVRYLINVRAVTASIIRKDRYYTGEPSETEAFVALKPKTFSAHGPYDTPLVHRNEHRPENLNVVSYDNHGPENSNFVLYTSICTKLVSFPVVNASDTGFFIGGSTVSRNVESSINKKKFISNRTIFDRSKIRKINDVDSRQFFPNEDKNFGTFCDLSLKYDNFTEKTDKFYEGAFWPPVVPTNVEDVSISRRLLKVDLAMVHQICRPKKEHRYTTKYFTYKQYKFDGLSTVVSEIEDNYSFGKLKDDGVDCPAVSASCFEVYVESLFLNDCAGLTKEYQSLDPASNDQCHIQPKLSFDNSLICENKPKNRYVNIVAYDHSRVALRHVLGCKHSDYINANFIDGFKRPRAYIATQGPLPNTFGDFWRMIWEQRCLVIVMITNVVERGRERCMRSNDAILIILKKKCDQYWPSFGESKYDDFVVKLINEHVTAFYTLRTLTLRHNKTLAKGAERMVLHYHYTHWPDHGVPDCIPPVLAFVMKSSNANRDNTAPIVVHCSAGVGRSGTYIVIDAMLKQLKTANALNIYGYLKHIRRQRNFLVQTEEQYAFCYNVILEAIKCGITEMSISEFVNHCAEKGNFVASNSSMIEQQYDLIYDFKFCGLPFTEAYKACNHAKNRHNDIVTCDRYRVTQSLKIDDGGYINATFFPGYRYFDEFIITQYPMEDTLEDFWRLICEYRIQFIILLHDSYDDEQRELSKFWPQDLNDELHLTSCHLTLNRLTTGDDWLCMDILMTRKDEELQSTCRIIQCPKWADSGRTFSDTWQVVYWLQEWQTIHVNNERSLSRASSSGGPQQLTSSEKMSNSSPPTVVVDLYGAKKAAQFCALSSLCYQIEQDSCLDVYQIVKVYTQRRSGIFQALDDYSFIFSCVEYLLNCGSKIEEIRDNASSIIENSSSKNGRKSCSTSYSKNFRLASDYCDKNRFDENHDRPSLQSYTNSNRRQSLLGNDLLLQIPGSTDYCTTNLLIDTKDTIL
uniref:protein-tyrosine-phosphatase n=1 Tax=Romanomermis culicivorax TaxID=13658 RepID=A0A915J583_ROMCU